MSPFRKITQQLNDLELKSPELEDFSTPIVAPPDLWPRDKTATVHGSRLIRSNSLTQLRTSPSLNLDIDAIHNLQHTVRAYNEHLQRKAKQQSVSHAPTTSNMGMVEFPTEDEMEATYQSLPVYMNSETNFTEPNFNQINEEDADDDDPMNSSIKLIDLDETIASNQSLATTAPKPIVNTSYRASMPPPLPPSNCNDYDSSTCSILATHNARFLDTKMMSTSPSANYYRPTEEPEPLDLTQLNIEASVMCLVSKIKFLCGRCGSPAIRLRNPKGAIKRAGFNNNPVPDVVDNGNSQTEPYTCEDTKAKEEGVLKSGSPNGNGNGLNLDLTQATMENQSTKKGNKFTDGMYFNTTNWP